MSITQRFYPKFFDFAFKIPVDGSPFFSLSGEMTCYVDLYTSGVSFDAERFLAINSNGVNIFDFDVPDTTKEINVTLTRTGAKIFFNIPEIYWETAPGSPFRHAIVRTPGLLSKTFMHIDFGSDLNPLTGFRLTQNPSCIPHIDFTPITCTGGGGGGENFDVMNPF